MLTRLQPFRCCCGGEGNANHRGVAVSSYISRRHALGPCSPGQDSREALCLAGKGSDSCDRRRGFEL